MLIGDKYLFLFCGGRLDRIKGLLWIGTGFLLLYKRFEAGCLSWPRMHTGGSGSYGRTIPLPDDGIKSTGAKRSKRWPPEKVY